MACVHCPGGPGCQSRSQLRLSQWPGTAWAAWAADGDPDSVKTFLAVSSTREDHHNHHNHPDDHYDDHHDDVLGEATDPECHRPGLQRIMGLRGQDYQGGGGEGPLQR